MQRTNERVVYMNGEIIPESSAVVSFRDRSFRYGDGDFDTTRTFSHRIFKLDQHLDRFYKTMRYLQLDIGVPHKKLADVELQVAHRLVEAVEMLVELEDAMAERPRRVEAAVAVAEAAVAERHHGAALRDDLPVHVDDTLVGPLHDLLSWPKKAVNLRGAPG